MHQIKQNLTKEEKRRRRVRAKYSGTAKRPRVSVFRSNRFTYVQAIDDVAGKTLAAASTKSLTKTAQKGSKLEMATAIAEQLATELKKDKIKEVVFDRGHYRYHGRVKQIAETLRSAGIKF